MVSFTFTAAAATAILAATVSATDSAKFTLKTDVVNGNKKFDNMYISTYHTGAGESAAVLTDSSLAEQFVLNNNTYIGFPVQESTETYYYFVDLLNIRPQQEYDNGKHFKPAAPAGYKYVAVNIGGDGTPGFKVGKASGAAITYSGSGKPFASFAACKVVDSLGGYGNGTELLWRTTAVKPDTSGQCADVKLIAEYVE